GDAELSLFNLSGQRVATLISGLREAGSYTLHWDGRDDAGRDLASGMYFYRLAAGDQVATQKLMLLR
ncbi:MAG: T9SS type A sorting domain-containing protein, partial [Gemmatimonadetes bacterium]|nr:T9SS type A sorting domain-containing protein [Gemmatimonadota bacterium]